MKTLILLKKSKITQFLQRESAKAMCMDKNRSLGCHWLWSVSCLYSDPGVLTTFDKDHASFFAARNSFASSAINIWQCVAIKKLTSMLSKQSAQISKFIPALTQIHTDHTNDLPQIKYV